MGGCCSKQEEPARGVPSAGQEPTHTASVATPQNAPPPAPQLPTHTADGKIIMRHAGGGCHLEVNPKSFKFWKMGPSAYSNIGVEFDFIEESKSAVEVLGSDWASAVDLLVDGVALQSAGRMRMGDTLFGRHWSISTAGSLSRDSVIELAVKGFGKVALPWTPEDAAANGGHTFK